MSLPTVKILPCSCKNEFQDKTYNKNQRVHNRGQEKGTHDNPYAEYKCTVCLNKQQHSK